MSRLPFSCRVVYQLNFAQSKITADVSVMMHYVSRSHVWKDENIDKNSEFIEYFAV